MHIPSLGRMVGRYENRAGQQVVIYYNRQIIDARKETKYMTQQQIVEWVKTYDQQEIK